ncbi:MAG: hypothetical protein JJV93_01900 [Alphaproteobacteria bacterium]|nr:hypothetical protein [Alphaproteobacteria bacterium]MBL0717999.1 hypothetical protein [Alphaproteobacteria bacterium]
MRGYIFKVVANPMQLFFAPAQIATINIIIQFTIFIILLAFSKGNFNPLFFLISLVISHSCIVAIAKKEPHIQSIILSAIKLNKIGIRSTGDKFYP